jgi:hypothetical protein
MSNINSLIPATLLLLSGTRAFPGLDVPFDTGIIATAELIDAAVGSDTPPNVIDPAETAPDAVNDAHETAPSPETPPVELATIGLLFETVPAVIPDSNDAAELILEALDKAVPPKVKEVQLKSLIPAMLPVDPATTFLLLEMVPATTPAPLSNSAFVEDKPPILLISAALLVTAVPPRVKAVVATLAAFVIFCDPIFKLPLIVPPALRSTEFVNVVSTAPRAIAISPRVSNVAGAESTTLAIALVTFPSVTD